MFLRVTVFCWSLSLLCSTLFSQVVEKLPNGAIEWDKRLIIAVGYGVINPNMPEAIQLVGAQKAAELDAMAKLLSVIQGMSVNASQTVDSVMKASHEVAGRVEGVLRNYRVLEHRVVQNGKVVEAEVAVPIDGAFSEIFLPPSQEPSPPDTQPLPTKEPEEKRFTGLVIDARGLEVKPAMNPKVISDEGEEVYGENHFLREKYLVHGAVGYCKETEKAVHDDRVKDNPRLVKAIKASGQQRSDLIIATEDAQEILADQECLHMLRECKVIFVID
jgi:hypothetical protein